MHHRIDPSLKANQILFAVVLFSVSIACQSFSLGDLSTINETALPISESAVPDTDWYSVYFTEPENVASSSYRGGPDSPLADAIRKARVSVDVAAHDFDLWSLRDALIDADRRGVKVRIVTESDNFDYEEIQELKQAGIPVLGDWGKGRMHNKFVIVDRQEVWTGSMNFTVSDTYRNENNLVRVRSTLMAENYTAEFEEMYLDGLFGSGSPANTPHQTLSVDTTLIEVYYSPDDGTINRLVELVDGAEKSIHFLAYSFTSDQLADAMIDRAQDGVTVEGVFDSYQYGSNTGTEYDRLKDAGLGIYLDGRSWKMHHKVIIIDEQIVITGSYNFSYSAETKNDENTLIIHNPEIAALYLEAYQKILKDAIR
jgi:phosphatidylserine/phosphatidylglycerophosphate/cardiolipin synthase-like enzyme